MTDQTMVEGTVSRLIGGMEILAVPVTHPHDIRHMQVELERGRYAIVEWILSELDRNRDLDRVAGLKANPLPEGGILFQLELRQPAVELEAWLKTHRDAVTIQGVWFDDGISFTAFSDRGQDTIRLSGESMKDEKFTDMNRPWWEDEDVQIPEAPCATDTGDNQDPPPPQSGEIPDHDDWTPAMRKGAGGWTL